jgi:hypothetical protein
LSRKQVDELLSLYKEIASTQWETLPNQLREAQTNSSHPRVTLDRILAKVLGETNLKLGELYKDLAHELALLADLMRSGGDGSEFKPDPSENDEEDA